VYQTSSPSHLIDGSQFPKRLVTLIYNNQHFLFNRTHFQSRVQKQLRHLVLTLLAFVNTHSQNKNLYFPGLLCNLNKNFLRRNLRWTLFKFWTIVSLRTPYNALVVVAQNHIPFQCRTVLFSWLLSKTHKIYIFHRSKQKAANRNVTSLRRSASLLLAVRAVLLEVCAQGGENAKPVVLNMGSVVHLGSAKQF